MMRTGAQRLARVLRGLVIAVFLCNLIALFLVPGLVFSEGDLTVTGYSVLQGLAVQLRMLALCWSWTIWLVMWAEHAHLVGAALFLLFCGVCTAVLLWQGKRVLDTICSGIPFHPENGVRMRRAALCCFLIAAAALGAHLLGTLDAWLYPASGYLQHPLLSRVFVGRAFMPSPVRPPSARRRN